MRLREQRLYSRTVSLKLRDEDFFTITRAVTLDHATQLDREIATAITALFRQAWDGKKPIRLLGVHAGSLQAVEGQMSLLEEAGAARLRRHSAPSIIFAISLEIPRSRSRKH